MNYIATSRPPTITTFVASALRSTSTNTGSLKDTSTPWPNFATGSLYVNLTSLTGTTGLPPTFIVRIQTSPDNGTTWLNAATFATMFTSTDTRRIDFRNGLSIGETGTSVNTTSTQLAANTVMTRDTRIAWEIANTTGVGPQANTATFAVYGIFKGTD